MKQTLKDWRARKNLSQVEAARILSVPVGTYRNWEQDRHIPTDVVKLAVLGKIEGDK